ncbi:WD40 repeat domain-containing protein, partial [Moorena producens]
FGRGNSTAHYYGHYLSDDALFHSVTSGHSFTLESVPRGDFAFTADGHSVAVAGPERPIRIYSTQTGELSAELPMDARSVRAAAVSPSQPVIATFIEGRVELWDWETNEQVWSVNLPGVSRLNELTFSPDGERLALAIEQGPNRLRVWDASTGDVLSEISAHDDAVRCVRFSPDGSLLASASRDCSIKIWGSQDYRLVETLKGHSGVVDEVAFAPDGRHLISASQDRTCVLWNVQNLKELNRFPEFPFTKSTPTQINHDVVAVLNYKNEHGRMYAFDMSTRKPIYGESYLGRTVGAFYLGPPGLISIGVDERVEIWANEQQKGLFAVGGKVCVLTISSNARVAYGCENGVIGVIDYERDELLEESDIHRGRVVGALKFDRTGQFLASGSNGKPTGTRGGYETVLLRSDSLEVVQRFNPEHKGEINDFAFDPDGKPRLV